MNGGDPAMAIAKARLFAASSLDDAAISLALGRLTDGGADLADLYFESARHRHWRLDNGRPVAGGFSIAQGVGVRAARDGGVAFAHTADLRVAALHDTIAAVHAMNRHGDAQRAATGVAMRRDAATHQTYPMAAPTDADAEEWIALLVRADALARAADPRVIRVDAQLRGSDAAMIVAGIDGTFAADIRPSMRFVVTVVVEEGSRRAQASAGSGGRYGLDGLTPDIVAETVARTVRIALTNLHARPAPAGVMPVVLGPGYPGVLFHEAVGHGLEGDHHRLRLSVFTDRVGERIAAPVVTVIDDGSVPERLGSLGVDDEGTPGSRNTLIEEGVLTGLMQDQFNAGLMNAVSTGNARRQSYAHLPMPRMTNTFLAPGAHDPADIIASVKSGIYAGEFGGGQVDIVTGRFNFTTTEAWLIEDGRLTAPIAGATLIGVGQEALRHVAMVGRDLALDPGEAVCAKQGQMLDVGVGQPTIRIDNMTIGGSRA